jgi:hypothetical protein
MGRKRILRHETDDNIRNIKKFEINMTFNFHLGRVSLTMLSAFFYNVLPGDVLKIYFFMFLQTASSSLLIIILFKLLVFENSYMDSVTFTFLICRIAATSRGSMPELTLK